MTPGALVVEDEPDIAGLVRHVLEERGFGVTVAATGADALREAERAAPDVIVLDLTLPDIAGLELLDTMRRDSTLSEVPVLVLSGRARAADVEAARARGAQDFLAKPCSPRELADRVLALVDPGREDS